MFATDRDLLAFEPRLFNEVAWAGQRPLDSASGGSIDSAGNTLTVTGARFVDWNITTGWVVLINDAPAEVISRFNQTQLYISRPREDVSATVSPLTTGSGLSVKAATFRPQLAQVHDQLMRAIGIEPGSSGFDPLKPTESSITNPKALIRAECLGALHLIYSAASLMVGPSSATWAKAQMYRDRFAAERLQLAVEIDLNNDAKPDAIRRINAMRLQRA